MNTNQSEAAKKWWDSLSDTDQCKTADNYGNMSLDDIYYYEVRQYEETKEETPLPETVEEAANKLSNNYSEGRIFSEREFYMCICRAYNAGKQNQTERFHNGDYAFISSHDYFVSEYPDYTIN